MSLLEISNMGNADPLLLVFLFVYIGQNYIQHPQLCQTDVTINGFKPEENSLKERAFSSALKTSCDREASSRILSVFLCSAVPLQCQGP